MITIFIPALNTDRTDVVRWCVERFGSLSILRIRLELVPGGRLVIVAEVVG